MRIKEFFYKKINVAWVTAVLIMIAILTICVATSHSKYVLEKELTFSLGIIESDEWNKRTLITGEELNTVLKDTGATQVVFGYEDDFFTEIAGVEGIAVGTEDTTKEFSADDIKLYTVVDTDSNNKEIIIAYILSDYQIKTNANSSKMFYNCEALTNIDFLNFETTIVENMDSMFYGCKNLTELDLSKFETPKLANIANMFYNDILLETIFVSKLWDINGIEVAQDNVFYNCVKLKGGNGTAYDEENPIITSDYACIDTAEDGETPAIPGYFTYKSSLTEEQVTFNLVRPSATQKTDTQNTSSSLTTTNTSTNTDTTNSNETTTSSNTTINNDDTKKETETETETENKDETETDTDTNTESNNTASNADTSLDDNSDSNNLDNTTEESESDKENTEQVEDGEKVEDKTIEETIESVESKETSNKEKQLQEEIERLKRQNEELMKK